MVPLEVLSTHWTPELNGYTQRKTVSFNCWLLGSGYGKLYLMNGEDLMGLYILLGTGSHYVTHQLFLVN